MKSSKGIPLNLTLEEFQKEFLLKKVETKKNEELFLILKLNDENYVLSSKKINFISDNLDYEKVEFSKALYEGYQYFYNQFYTIINFNELNNNNNNDDISSQSQIIYIKDFKLGLLINLEDINVIAVKTEKIPQLLDILKRDNNKEYKILDIEYLNHYL